MQRIKLFDKLDADKNSSHAEQECCTETLSSDEVHLLNDCFEKATELTEIERATLFYICGYVAQKEKMPTNDTPCNESHSEFTKLLSRGKLRFPSEELFDLSLYLLSYYKNVEMKSCTNRMVTAFQKIYDFTNYDIPNFNAVLRRFANCFSKAYAAKESDHLKSNIKLKNIKKLRLSNN